LLARVGAISRETSKGLLLLARPAGMCVLFRAQTALHKAAWNRRQDVCSMLVAAGASLTKTDHQVTHVIQFEIPAPLELVDTEPTQHRRKSGWNSC